MNGQLSLGKAEHIVQTYPDKQKQDKQVAIVAKSKMATRVKNLTGEYEWYTPRQYLDAAVEVKVARVSHSTLKPMDYYMMRPNCIVMSLSISTATKSVNTAPSKLPPGSST
jgi:hypothetical protein